MLIFFLLLICYPCYLGNYQSRFYTPSTACVCLCTVYPRQLAAESRILQSLTADLDMVVSIHPTHSNLPNLHRPLINQKKHGTHRSVNTLTAINFEGPRAMRRNSIRDFVHFLFLQFSLQYDMLLQSHIMLSDILQKILADYSYLNP